MAESATVQAPQPVKAGDSNRRALVFLAVGVALLLAVFVGKVFIAGGSSHAPSSSAANPPAAAAPGSGAATPTTTAPTVPPPPPGPAPNTTRDPFHPLR